MIWRKLTLYLFIADTWRDWRQIITDYSERHLQYDADRLPALSGAATRYHQITKSRYLAGLWEHDIAYQLCWRVGTGSLEDIKLAYPHHQYLASSWFWVSIFQPVLYERSATDASFHQGLTIIDVQCEVPGLNPFGQVTEGYIRLRGKVVKIHVTYNGTVKYFKHRVEEWTAGRFSPDYTLVHEDGIVVRATRGQTPPSRFTGSAVCLFIGVMDKMEMREEAIDFALVLQRSDSENDTFHRIGLLQGEHIDGYSLFEAAPDREICII